MIKDKDINRSGRPKGSSNKSTAQVRDRFQLLIDDNLDQLGDDLKALKPKERIDAILGLARFVMPQLASVTLENSAMFNPVIIELNENNN